MARVPTEAALAAPTPSVTSIAKRVRATSSVAHARRVPGSAPTARVSVAPTASVTSLAKTTTAKRYVQAARNASFDVRVGTATSTVVEER